MCSNNNVIMCNHVITYDSSHADLNAGLGGVAVRGTIQFNIINHSSI